MTSASPQVLTVYSTDHCGDCIRSKRFLDSHGVKYSSINIEHDEMAAKHVMSLNNGYQSVPVITFPDGSHLTEPSDRALEAKLKELSLL